MPEINFFWDPLSDNILQERDETGAVTAEYTAEPGLYGNVISQNRSGVESQFHYDGQGSTIAVTDDNQNVTDTFAYAAFGEVIERTGTTEVPFQYIGQKGYYRDNTTGQYLVRRRVFEPARARWLVADAFPRSDDRNLYRYVHNSPTNWHDSSGQAVQSNASLYPFIPGIVVVDAKISPCFSASFAVYFTVPSHLTSGWIVQEIESELQVLTCDGRDITTKISERYKHFWEAFDIASIRIPGEAIDTFRRSGQLNNTRGSYRVRGTAKGAGNVALPETFIEGQIPEAGELPSTYLEPPGWDHLPGAPHNMTVTWDCCCRPHCVLMHTTPGWSLDLPPSSEGPAGCPVQIPIFDLSDE